MNRQEVIDGLKDIWEALGQPDWDDSALPNDQLVHERRASYGDRLDPISDFQIMSISKEGIDAGIAEKISKSFSFSQKEVSDMLHISDRSYRNHLKHQRPFTGLEAEMLVTLLNLIKEGIDTFEDPDSFKTWMNLQIEALGYRKPNDFLHTISGTRYITEFLKSIQASAFA